MGGIKEPQTSFNTTWLTIHSFIHSFFYGFEHASQILVIAFPRGFFICADRPQKKKIWEKIGNFFL